MAVAGISCAVLGGGGFLGTNLCRRLVACGATVRAFGRRNPFAKTSSGVDWEEGDFSNRASLSRALERADVVFHLIHTKTPYQSNLNVVADLQENVVATLAMLDLCLVSKVKRLVFVSSGGTIYGAAEQIPTPETAPPQPLSGYGISKLSIERYLALYQHLHGLEFRILRVANPFGPFQIAVKRQGLIAELISRSIAHEPIEIWGDGSDVRDYIFVEDVVDALILAAEDHGPEQIYNIGSGRGRSVREVIRAIENAVGAPLALSWKERRKIDIPVSVLSVERARTGLGWEPRTDFETGIHRTLEWWHRERVVHGAGSAEIAGKSTQREP